MKTTTIKKIITVFPLILISFLACNAPRRNPLDPNNPEHHFGVLSGQVRTLTVPNKPLSDVLVTYPQADLVTFTDKNGNFSWNELERQNGTLYFQKSGYFLDSLSLKWGDKKELAVRSYLNALPVVSDLHVYSVVYNRYPSLRKFQVSVRARVSDTDNDIDSVHVVNSLFKKSDLFAFNTVSRTFEIDYTLADLGVQSINAVVGCPFDIRVTDKFGHRIIAASASVMRVIYDEVTFITPANYQPVSSLPTLEWQALLPGFPFTYSVEIYYNEIIPQLVWQKEGFPSDVTSCTVDRALDPGEYFWIISCVDEFNNRSRSKPASFKVE